MKTTNSALDYTILNTTRGTTRSVVLRLDNVAAPGVVWTPTCRRRVIELTSVDGAPVNVSVHNAEGIAVELGSVASYAPANNCNNIVADTFAAAWFSTQKSQAARKAFIASMS